MTLASTILDNLVQVTRAQGPSPRPPHQAQTPHPTLGTAWPHDRTRRGTCAGRRARHTHWMTTATTSSTTGRWIITLTYSVFKAVLLLWGGLFNRRRRPDWTYFSVCHFVLQLFIDKTLGTGMSQFTSYTK